MRATGVTAEGVLRPPVVRDAKGRITGAGAPLWPDGRRKDPEGLKKGGEDAIKYLCAIVAGEEKVSDDLRYRAAVWLAERVFGKAREQLDVSVTESQTVTRVLRVVVESSDHVPELSGAGDGELVGETTPTATKALPVEE